MKSPKNSTDKKVKAPLFATLAKGKALVVRTGIKAGASEGRKKGG